MSSRDSDSSDGESRGGRHATRGGNVPFAGHYMRFGVVEKVLICTHCEREPDNEDWNGFLAMLEANIPILRGVLVFTPGPGPDAARRKRIAEINSKRQIPTAVLTGSRVTRGIVTAISWFGVRIRAFEPRHLDEALNHVGVEPGLRATVLMAFEAAQKAVNESLVASASR